MPILIQEHAKPMGEISIRKEKIAALLLFVFALVYLYGCLKLRIGHVGNPGPGFLPLVVGLLLIFFTGLNLLRTLYRRPLAGHADEEDSTSKANLFIALGTVACVVAYPFLLRGLKYVVSTFIVMFLMLAINRYKHPALNAVMALVIALASFVFFSMILGVVLPNGWVETFILRFR